MTTARCPGVATLNVSCLQLIKGRMLILSQRVSVVKINTRLKARDKSVEHDMKTKSI